MEQTVRNIACCTVGCILKSSTMHHRRMKSKPLYRQAAERSLLGTYIYIKVVTGSHSVAFPIVLSLRILSVNTTCSFPQLILLSYDLHNSGTMLPFWRSDVCCTHGTQPVRVWMKSRRIDISLSSAHPSTVRRAKHAFYYAKFYVALYSSAPTRK